MIDGQDLQRVKDALFVFGEGTHIAWPEFCATIPYPSVQIAHWLGIMVRLKLIRLEVVRADVTNGFRYWKEDK
ncbi:MAG: hypothetical protein SFU83_23550 [Meiothermus sp.]|nr:hypothetical protein [Meiothermus sp.]